MFMHHTYFLSVFMSEKDRKWMQPYISAPDSTIKWRIM